MTNNSSYIPIHPMVLRIDTFLLFNVYQENEKQEHELFHPAGERYTYKDHNRVFINSIPVLYVKGDDKNYFSYLENNIFMILSDPIISIPSKAEIIHSMLQYYAMESIFNSTKENILKYENVIKIFIDLITDNNTFLKSFIQLTKSSFNEFNHLVNVGIYAIALTLELPEKEINKNLYEIASGFFLHDIGKNTIPKSISLKKTPLTEEEWEVIKKHPQEGFRIINDYGLMTNEAEIIILQHHERHDGKGYPLGLKENQIHPYGKICAISDAFDALTSNRPYRNATSTFNALDVMYKEMKEEFDPEFFSRFVLLFKKSV